MAILPALFFGIIILLVVGLFHAGVRDILLETGAWIWSEVGRALTGAPAVNPFLQARLRSLRRAGIFFLGLCLGTVLLFGAGVKYNYPAMIIFFGAILTMGAFILFLVSQKWHGPTNLTSGVSSGLGILVLILASVIMLAIYFPERINGPLGLALAGLSVLSVMFLVVGSLLGRNTIAPHKLVLAGAVLIFLLGSFGTWGKITFAEEISLSQAFGSLYRTNLAETTAHVTATAEIRDLIVTSEFIGFYETNGSPKVVDGKITNLERVVVGGKWKKATQGTILRIYNPKVPLKGTMGDPVYEIAEKDELGESVIRGPKQYVTADPSKVQIQPSTSNSSNGGVVSSRSNQAGMALGTTPSEVVSITILRNNNTEDVDITYGADQTEGYYGGGFARTEMLEITWDEKFTFFPRRENTTLTPPVSGFTSGNIPKDLDKSKLIRPDLPAGCVYLETSDGKTYPMKGKRLLVKNRSGDLLNYRFRHNDTLEGFGHHGGSYGLRVRILSNPEFNSGNKEE